MIDEKCALCDIPSDRILEETSLTVTALFQNPQVPGHVIVAAKQHKRFPNELSEDANAQLGRGVAHAFQRAAQLAGTERCYVAVVGDRDFHFHYHVLPYHKDMAPLGPYLFGDNGWASNANKDQIAEMSAQFMSLWRE